MEVKVIKIVNDRPNICFEFNSADGHLLDWNKLSETEQLRVLTALADVYNCCRKTLKNG